MAVKISHERKREHKYENQRIWFRMLSEYWRREHEGSNQFVNHGSNATPRSLWVVPVANTYEAIQGSLASILGYLNRL